MAANLTPCRESCESGPSTDMFRESADGGF